MERKVNLLKRKFSSFESEKLMPIVTDEPWAEKYTPETVEELCVHKKKILEVETWFHNCFQQTKYKVAPVLLLAGPPGAGKTASVKVICKRINADVFVWTNNSPAQFLKSIHYEDLLSINNKNWVETENQSSAFSRFLFQSTKYSLFSECKRVILVEEFPNAFLLDPNLFHTILRKYSVCGRTPAVFIVSDGAKSESIENRLFPKDLQLALKISNISFNPVAPSMLMKVLSRINSCIINESNHKKLTKSQLEDIVGDSIGDVRNAINSMQFLCVSNSYKKEKIKSGLKNKKYQTVNEDKLHDSRRDCPLFLFHALGKVLYCKREPSLKSKSSELPEHMKHLEKDPLVANAEEVFEKTSISAEGFALFLQENYLSFVSDVSIASECSFWLSEGDILSSYWNEKKVFDDYMISVVTRGLMFNIVNSTSGNRWRPLHKPEFYDNVKKANSIKGAIKNCFEEKSLSLSELQTEYIPFFSKLKSNKFTSQQAALLTELGEMKVKRLYRPEFKPLNEKDVVQLDTEDSEVTLSYKKSSSFDNDQFSEDEVIIEEYD